MKTYMILVNGKYMVKANLETESLGGAEHYILDNFHGACEALAFDEKTIATKWFVRDYLANAEMISIAELKRMSEEHKKAWSEYVEASAEYEAKQAEIEQMRKNLEDLEKEKRELWQKMNAKKNARMDADTAMNATI